MPGSYLSRRMLLALGAGLAARPVFAQEAPPDPKAPAVSEDDLLLEVLRYLRADRRQIALLLGIARQTDRRRMVLTQEAERAVKALERTGTEKEIEAGKASIEEGRQRAIADILKFAGPQMVRIFLREQIGLAWRLEQGRPPEYARADASLLPPEAGFVNPNTPWNAYSRVEILRSGDGGLVDLFLNQAPQDGGELAPLLLKSADVSLDIAGVRDARRLYVSDLLTAEHALGGNRPFPQQLVESNNLEELAQQIEPFTRRLFLSERIVPVLEHASAHGLGVMSGGSRAPSGNLKLLRNYRMELGLRDRTGHGPELEPLGGQLILCTSSRPARACGPTTWA